jgi:hypothetical protein
MHAKTPPTRPLPPPAFQPLIGPPAQWRPQVLHHLTRTAQQQRAILIHDDPVFAHHLQATLEHTDLRVCSLTPRPIHVRRMPPPSCSVPTCTQSGDFSCMRTP